jgi:hypothetical protein
MNAEIIESKLTDGSPVYSVVVSDRYGAVEFHTVDADDARKLRDAMSLLAIDMDVRRMGESRLPHVAAI